MSEAPLCKVVDIVFVRFELKDLSVQKEYLEHFGMHLVRETQDAIYYKGSGSAPFLYTASKGSENRYVSAGYRVDNYSELKNLAAHFDVVIEQNQESGGGHKVTLSDPDGLGIEVFHGLELSDVEIAPEPILNTSANKSRINELQRFGKGSDEWVLKDDEWVYGLKAGVMRLGHTAINVANAPASMQWYQDTLGFLITDNLMMPDGNCLGAFMRVDQGDVPVDHHVMNIIGTMPGKEQYAGSFGHAGFEVNESVDSLMAGHFHMKTQDKYYHEWGIGRHLLGSQMYDYWRDPQGFTLEHWTDGDLLDATVPTTDVPARDLIMAQYGPLAPATFGLSMPSEDVDAYRDENASLSEMVKMFEAGK